LPASMMRSLSFRSRWAAASKRASAEPRVVRVERDLLVLERVPLFDERARLLVALEPDDRVDVERDDFADDERARREPVPEPDLPEPPLLACGMLPPSSVTGRLPAPYLARTPGGNTPRHPETPRAR
jgi:hypothetical protein